MSPIGHDPSVDHEGFDNAGHRSPDRAADEPALRGAPARLGKDEAAAHNVWDEPATRAAGTAPPPQALTYARWYRDGLANTSPLHSWLVTLFLVATGGLFAILGVFLSHPRPGVQGILMLVLIGPALEEMLKIGATAIMVENRPYLFRSAAQIVIAVAASALVFSVLENVLYIHVYHRDATETFRLWRWTVCTALHVGATLIAGMGLVKSWRKGREDLTKPRMEHAYPYIVTAVILHGAYNCFATILQGVLRPF